VAFGLALRQHRQNGPPFAERKSIAEAFLHAAAHAPQPMQAAASIAASAVVWEMGRQVAVLGAAGVHADGRGWMMRSKRLDRRPI